MSEKRHLWSTALVTNCHGKIVTSQINTLTAVQDELRVGYLLEPPGYVMHQEAQHSTIVFSAHTVFMCFVFI